MAIRQLPAIEWLGYSIDLSRSPTMDLRSASSSVLKGRRIIDFDTDGKLREVTIKNETFDVPESVRVSQESLYQGNFVSYSSGGNAKKAFRKDAELPALYFAVRGQDNASSLALDRSFTARNQYAFYSFTTSVYAARLAEYQDSLDETALLRGVESLPKPFSGDSESVLAAYKEFFQRFGTHVIVNASYGARFQLNGWASNEDPSVNAKFATDVKAYFNGVVNGGEYDKNVKSETQYKAFFEYFQRIVTVVGGDTQLSSSLMSNPTDSAKYEQWSSTICGSTASHIGFTTTPMWTLMSGSGSDSLKTYADELDRAFMWMLTNPRVYKTAVVFDLQSDWAEFNLLTPDAVIEPDGAYPYPPNGTVASPSRVKWRGETSQQKTLRFFIVNDGSPIDFSISHGSDGAQSRKGRAEAFIENQSYLNDKISDNAWNTIWYFAKPVSSKPVGVV